MQIRLSLSVMLSPSPVRRKIVENMVRALSEDAGMLAGGAAMVLEDTWREGVTPTGLRAWQMHHSQATHHAVLQDDVAVCPGFIPALLQIIALYPDAFLNTEHHAPSIRDLAEEHGVHVVETPGTTNGQGMVAPVPMIPDFIRWQAEYIRPEDPWYDCRWAAYCWYNRVQTLSLNPTLTQHLLPMNSLLGHNVGKYRTSPDWIVDRGVSALDIPWHLGHPTPPVAKPGSRYRLTLRKRLDTATRA